VTDLVIINPAGAHGIYGPLGDELVAVEPPQWCRIIAGYIRDRGFSVKILDAEAERQGHHEVGQIVRDMRPKFACVAVYGHQPSASTQQMWGAGLVAKAVKAQSDCKVIMLGGHPSALPDRTFTEESVDFVGVGEGALTILGLLRGDKVESVPGLVWLHRTGTTCGPCVNKSAPLIEDLGQLHGHAWDLLPMDKYRAHNWQCFGDIQRRQPYASIYTSLGCPYKCQFCCINAPFDSNRYRMRRPSDVVDEVEYLFEEHGVSTIKITDEMFVLNKKHYIAIADGLVRRGLGAKVNIWAYARVDTVEPAALDLLRAAGIRWLALGIESGSKFVRDGAAKNLRSDDIVGTVKTIQAHGISVIGNFMFGLRDDTAGTMQETLDLALECVPDFANFYCFPAGTPVYTPNGATAIEKLAVGDEVLSASGTTTVITPMSRHYKGKVYEVKPRYLPPITMTDEHPVRVVTVSRDRRNNIILSSERWEQPRNLRPYRSHRIPFDAVVVPKDMRHSNARIDFSPYLMGRVGPGRRGGQLGEAKRFLTPWPVSFELAELFGWYVAEGSRFSRKNNQIGFSLGVDEPENVARVRWLVQHCFGYRTQAHSRDSVTRISFTSKVMMRAFPALMGDTSQTKKVPQCVMNGSPEIAAAFLLGYVAGDGTSYPNPNGQFSISTASEVLARQLLLLFFKVGIIPGWCETQPTLHWLKGKPVKTGRQFKLSWTSASANHFFQNKEVYFIPIKSVRCRKFDGRVYNIETADHTYQVPFLVHNCTMAYPGSALYAQAVKEGWTLPETWRGYSQHNDDCRPLDTEHIGGRDVLAFRDAAFTRFFTDEGYRTHVANKFGADTLAHVDKMTTFKLRRKLLEDSA
jgi:radical SAM superfamily enzyme YgiQ (UPF0313 family)